MVEGVITHVGHWLNKGLVAYNPFQSPLCAKNERLLIAEETILTGNDLKGSYTNNTQTAVIFIDVCDRKVALRVRESRAYRYKLNEVVILTLFLHKLSGRNCLQTKAKTV